MIDLLTDYKTIKSSLEIRLGVSPVNPVPPRKAKRGSVKRWRQTILLINKFIVSGTKFFL